MNANQRSLLLHSVLAIAVLGQFACTPPPTYHLGPDRTVAMSHEDTAALVVRLLESAVSPPLTEVRIEQGGIAFHCDQCHREDARIPLRELAGIEIHQPGYNITLVRKNGGKLIQLRLGSRDHVTQLVHALNRLRLQAAREQGKQVAPLDIQHTRRMGGGLVAPAVTTSVVASKTNRSTHAIHPQDGAVPRSGQRGQYGFFAGLGMSHLTMDESGELGVPETTLGPVVGVGMHYGGRSPVALDMRLSLIRKGARLPVAIPLLADQDLGLWYLEVPVLARLGGHIGQHIGWFLYGGGSFSMYVAGQGTTDLADYLMKQDRLDVGVTVGGGIQWRHGGGNSIDLDVRQTWGTRDLGFLPGSNNRTLSISLGYSR